LDQSPPSPLSRYIVARLILPPCFFLSPSQHHALSRLPCRPISSRRRTRIEHPVPQVRLVLPLQLRRSWRVRKLIGPSGRLTGSSRSEKIKDGRTLRLPNSASLNLYFLRLVMFLLGRQDESMQLTHMGFLVCCLARRYRFAQMYRDQAA
jgi:hypothetical protein